MDSLLEFLQHLLLGPVTGSSRAPSHDLKILSPSILFALDVIRQLPC